MIALMASSGMRRGALPHLRLRDIQKIERYGILKFNVYKKEQESYITYCTPECTQLIGQHLKWRERLGEKFTPNTPLFRLVFDTTLEVNRPKPIQSEAIARRINQLLQDSEVRISTGSKRTEIMETHGLRKFFKTTCINAGMHPLYSEYLMGHKSGLTKSYFKPTDTELLEGNEKALGYVSVINDPTIVDQRRGLIMTSCNIWIFCWDNVPFAKTRAPHVLHLSIIRPVLVGLSVAIELQNRQCTILSHGSIRDNFL
jgi:Phage integrase family